MKYNLFSLFLLIVFATACNKKKLPDSCEGVMCTANFAMISVNIVDSVGNPFLPQKVETVNMQNDVVLVDTNASIPFQNMYNVLTDSEKDILGINIENTFIYHVYQNNNIVATDTFIIKADCCHIIKVKGNNTLVVK